MGVLKDLDCRLAEYLETILLHFHPSKVPEHRINSLEEELLCSCERARHAIKEFTNQGGDGIVSDCFQVAGDALCDLQWCLEILFPGSVQIEQNRAARSVSEARIWIWFPWLAVPRKLTPGFWTKARTKARRERIHNRLRPDVYTRVSYDLLTTECYIVPLITPQVVRLCLDFHAAESLQRRVFKFERASLTALVRQWKGGSLDAPASGSARLPANLNLDDLGELQYLEKLGEGSYGAVHKARWCSHNAGAGATGPHLKAWSELVAVKEISSEILDESLEALSRSTGASRGCRSGLDNELNVLRTLNHPNIVELKGYTMKATAAKYGLVMELMKYSLGDLIKSTTLSDLVKADTLLQVARGMHFLHKAAGIMHRDLKPANILIGELNYLPPYARRLGYVVAKLADFGLSKGLSKQVDGVDRHTFKRGTYFYMAPELCKSCNDDQNSAWYAKSADVFSFGTTCFNVLTGEETPCTEPLDFYTRIKRRDVDQWLEKCGPPQMRLLVRQCWSPDPNSRPPFIKICRILEKEKRRIFEEENLLSTI